MICLGFGDTTGDDANTNFGHELYRNARTGVGALEVIYQLLEVLDTIYIMVRRRADETDTGSRVASTCDGSRDLVTRKLASFSRLRTLGHLDLKLVCVGQIVGRDTETARGDLLDGRTHRIAIRKDVGAFCVFASFARVGLSAEAVHGDRESRMRLHGNGTVRHCTCDKSANNLVPRLDLFDWDRRDLVKLELEKSTEGRAFDLLIRAFGITVVGLLVLLADGILKVGDALWVVDMGLATVTPVVLSRLGHARW